MSVHREIWRKEISQLSDKDLLDELTTPTSNWKEDVLRESLKRILTIVLELKSTVLTGAKK